MTSTIQLDVAPAFREKVMGLQINPATPCGGKQIISNGHGNHPAGAAARFRIGPPPHGHFRPSDHFSDLFKAATNLDYIFRWCLHTPVKALFATFCQAGYSFFRYFFDPGIPASSRHD
ncbi:MAG TPA: hypothetical protein ENK28_04890 [Aliiroseovarius sp.]|nr:hypothetical protein [Aliiroseovarius sp.]